jgi:hypothetical protein
MKGRRQKAAYAGDVFEFQLSDEFMNGTVTPKAFLSFSLAVTPGIDCSMT